MPGSSDIFLFADFRFDPAGGGLFRRDDHGSFAPVAIGSRALDLLAALIDRRGDVVSKEEIMAAVWPKTAVEEANLFVQISALRAILDREQSGQSCIQTVAGRGYRFVAPVTRCAELRSTPAEEPLRATPARSDAAPRAPERRYITAFAAELAPALGGRLPADPEDLGVIVGAFRRLTSAVLTRMEA
jgi:DNA-binding winged helix-turn-helix (wHTH) protein